MSTKQNDILREQWEDGHTNCYRSDLSWWARLDDDPTAQAQFQAMMDEQPEQDDGSQP